MAATLESGLTTAGLCVDLCHDGQEGLLLALTGDYDVIVLDPLLREANGYLVSAELRRLQVRTPILQLTTGSSELDAERCSCIAAQLRALYRRGVCEPLGPRSAGDFTLDVARHVCRRGAVEVPLTPRECALLEFLLRRTGQVVSQQEILDQVWDFAFDCTPRMIERSISSLRRKLDRPFAHQRIQIVGDVGYRLLAHHE